MNRIEQINNEIAALEAQIEALKAEREELAAAEPTVEYTATDKKRVTVNGEVVAERGGKTVPARVKVAAFREVNLLKNDDGSLVRDENGRGVYGETGKIVYGVKYSNMDALKLRNEDDGMYPMSIRLWTKIVELSA